jgi:3-oxoacyl-[acyl-carrier-protein] synthase-3
MTGIGFSRISLSIPDNRDRVDEILAAAGSSEAERRMFTRIFKLQHSPSWTLDDRLDDLLVEVGCRALAGDGADLVLYGHSLQMQEVNFRPGFAQRVQKGLCLESVPFFGVSGRACTSVLRTVDLARDYLSARRGQRRVLVLGGDHGAAFSGARVVPRMTVLGDAVGAFVVGRGDFRYRYLAAASRSDSRFHRGMRMDTEELRLFGHACGEHILDALTEATRSAGMAVNDLDWVMPHLVNKLSWKVFSQHSGIPYERFHLDLLASQGHVYGLDALTSLEHADRSGRLRPGDRCALVAVGQGAYFHVLVIEVVEQP